MTGHDLSSAQRAMVDIWERHTAAEFGSKSVKATMETMTADPVVNHVPVMTGGVGRDAVRQFYATLFVPRTAGGGSTAHAFTMNVPRDRQRVVPRTARKRPSKSRRWVRRNGVFAGCFEEYYFSVDALMIQRDLKRQASLQVEVLRRAGARFRNDMVVGQGGKQILLDDPAGNPIELFEARRHDA